MHILGGRHGCVGRDRRSQNGAGREPSGPTPARCTTVRLRSHGHHALWPRPKVAATGPHHGDAIRAGERFGVDPRRIIIALGERQAVVGQEDMIIDVAASLAAR